MNEHVPNQNRPWIRPGIQGGMNRRNPEHNTVHHQIDTEAIQNAADDRMLDHKGNHPAGEEVDTRYDDRNQVMEAETENGDLDPAIARGRAERSRSDRSKHGAGRDAAPHVAENTGIRDIKSSGHQTGSKNCQQGSPDIQVFLFWGVNKRAETIYSNPEVKTIDLTVKQSLVLNSW